MGVDGFAGDAACTLTPGGRRSRRSGRGRGAPPAAGPPLSAARKDQVGRCEPTLTIPADARVSEPYWHREGEAGRYTFDDDAPFGLPYRPTPFYVQVTLSLGPNTEEVFTGCRCSSATRATSSAARSDRAARGAGVVGARLARDRDRAVDAACTRRRDRPTTAGSAAAAPAPPRRPPRAAGEGPLRPAAAARRNHRNARGSRHRRQRHERRAESVVTLELPEGWTVHARRAEGHVLARGRIADGAIPGARRRGRQRGRVHVSARASVGAASFNRGYQIDRISAHHAAAHLSRGGDAAEGHGRQDGAESDSRLHHGRRRRSAGSVDAARRKVDSCSRTIWPGATCRGSPRS